MALRQSSARDDQNQEIINIVRRPPPSVSLESFHWVMDNLCSDNRGRVKVGVGGDFNALTEEWGSSFTNSRGRTIIEAILLTVGVTRSNSLSSAGQGKAYRQDTFRKVTF